MERDELLSGLSVQEGEAVKDVVTQNSGTRFMIQAP